MTSTPANPFRGRAVAPDPDSGESAASDADHERLVALSLPAMESLYQQLGSPTLTVLLADRQGLILSMVGSHSNTTPALLGGLRIAQSGAHIETPPSAEPGDANAEAGLSAPMSDGAFPNTASFRHPLPMHRSVLGVAAPLLAPDRAMLGIIDVAASPNDSFSHANALLQTTAAIIEHRLIESDEQGFLLLRFHSRQGVLGSPLEALAVFDRDSRLLVANSVAAHLLALTDHDTITHCPDHFEAQWIGLVGHATLSAPEPFMLRGCHGTNYYAHASLR